jgi:aryl-alcohol dehydrogenase-like predicted oxidoreductase
MKARVLGAQGPEVSAIGLGTMAMSDLRGPRDDEEESIATIRKALDEGITLIDTGDFYGTGDNERLIAQATRGRPRDEFLLSVKFGAMRTPDGSWTGPDARPAAVKNSLAYSLRRLRVDYIDVYRPARLDPAVPIEDTVGAIKEMIDAGYVRYVGLSEVGVDTIRRAHAVHPVSDVQLEYSLLSRGIEDHILPATRELGISITAYGVLGRGLLGGHWSQDRQLDASDYRAHIPRYQAANLEHNLRLVDALARTAPLPSVTPAQLAVAWVLSQGEDIVPVVGARTRDRLEEALGAPHIHLGSDDLARIEQAVPRGSAAGERDIPASAAALDSERPPAS